ncbi:MAG TPA: DUF488 family protein [Dongiaceae bacterium]|jgi:uncharacterized protein YeaO (DUF488 family)|nr:DUF488 family protein [Dongiaceae bacterium]
MAIAIIQLGTPREKGELRLGTVRRPPRGVRKADYARLGYYDLWLPVLSPSPPTMRRARQGLEDEKSWRAFERAFLREMKKPIAAQALDLLAAFSHRADFSLGCYCEDERRCHRSLLRRLLRQRGASLA